MDKMRTFSCEALMKAKKAKGRDVILVIGNTGAGKSTTINYLLGHKFTKGRNYPFQISLVDESKSDVQIGHTMTSQTLYAEAHGSEDGFVYCDTPGFLDTRPREEKICASINIEFAIKSARQIKAIIVVVDYYAIPIDKGRSLRDLSTTISQFLKSETFGLQRAN
jgi:ribosome biogenesis GTPase A